MSLRRHFEAVEAAAVRRLGEEMGFACPLERLGLVRYDAAFGNELADREIVHVFRGLYDGPIVADAAEAEGFRPSRSECF